MPSSPNYLPIRTGSSSDRLSLCRERERARERERIRGLNNFSSLRDDNPAGSAFSDWTYIDCRDAYRDDASSEASDFVRERVRVGDPEVIGGPFDLEIPDERPPERDR